MIKKIIRYFLLCVLFFGGGFLYAWKYPQAKLWAIHQLIEAADKKAHIALSIQDLSIGLFPPQISLQKIAARPKSSLAETMSPVTIEELYVSLHLPSLLSGRLQLDTIRITEPVVSFVFKKGPESETEEKKPLQLPWEQIIRLPFKRITIEKLDSRLQIDSLDLFTQFKNFNLTIEKTDRAILTEIDAPDFWIKRKNVESSLTKAQLQTRVLAQRDALQVAFIKFVYDKNYFIASGLARGSVPQMEFNSINGRLIAESDLENLASWAHNLFPTINLPKTTGKVKIQADATKVVGKNPFFLIKAQLDSLKVDQFFLGNVSAEALLHDDILESKSISIENPAGNVTIENLFLDLKNENKVAARISIKELEIKKLLLALEVGDTPIHIPASGRIPCDGTLKPFNINCSGEMFIHDFLVYSPSKKPIVAADSLAAIGTFNVNAERIHFPLAQMSVGDSVGQVWGEINFKKGFHFGFHTDDFNFKNLKSLADLKFEGALRMDGVTEGDGHSAFLDFHGTSRDFWFEDYGIGAADMGVRYEKGYLSLKNIRGEFGTSVYQGSAKFHLEDPTNVEAALQSDKIELFDLKQMFGRRAKVPIQADGTTKFSLNVSGPLEFNQLTYTLKTSTPSGVIQNESIKDLHFDVHADKGVVRSDRISIRKGDGLIVAQGEGFPSGDIKLNVKGSGLHLEDFDSLKRLGLQISGGLNVDLALGGYVLKPKTDLRLAANDMLINGQEFGNSRLGMSLDSDELKGQGQLADQVQGNFIIPLSPKGRFELKLKMDDYDFSPFFNLIVGNTSRRDFETSLTARIALFSSNGGFLNSAGKIEVPNIYIRHGTTQARNPEPWVVQFSEGNIRFDNIKLQGDATQLTIKGQRSSEGLTNVNFNGRISLALLSFLTPFFQDLRGDLTLSTQLTSKNDDIEVIGSAFIDQGFIKLPDFPHPLEDLKADILFSQARALVNRFKARFAGGTLSATGTVAFKGLANFPVDLSGELDHVTLKIPDGLETKGSGIFSISGSWFPYLLRGDYNVTSGLYAKNFGDDSTDSLFVKRSQYLPDTLLKKEVEPIEFQIATNFNKDVFVRNTNIDAEVHGNIEITGTPKKPGLKGEIITVPGGKIFFKDTPFTIGSASVKFSNPYELNPFIYVQASSRVRNYDVSMIVQSPLNKFKMDLSSQPPLPEQSIISLLALGVADDEFDKQTGGEQLSANAYQVGSVVLADNPLQKAIRKGLDVNVRLSTKVDETKNTTAASVVAEKQWGPRFKTSVSKTYDDRNTRDVSAEYKLNRNFSVIGSYEGKDASTLTTTTSTGESSTTGGASTDVLGLDLQYQVDFK